MTGARIFGIIVGKFSDKKKPCLIIIFKIDKYSKVNLYNIILSLNLAICLLIKGDRESSLDVKKIT